MNCQRIQSLISAYIDHELNPEEKRIIRKHLSVCVECDAEYQEFLLLKNQLENTIPEPVGFDAIGDLRIRIANEERTIIPPVQSFIWLKRCGIVAASFLAFLIGSLLLFPASQKGLSSLALQPQPFSRTPGANAKLVTTPASISYDQSLSFDQSVSIYQASTIVTP